MKSSAIFFLSVWVLLWNCASGTARPLSLKILKEKPKLVVVISVDQFRADYLTRFLPKFLPAINHRGEIGGFQYLMTNGAYFPHGQYGMLQNMTGPGHATILSGAYPYQSGIALNNWFDTKRNMPVYCVEDADHATIELAKPPKEHLGTSPKNFLGTTVGDELKNAGYPGQVVSIALKDRAAILMGGHRADLALWFDSDAQQWVSSKFYFPDGKLPEWVKKMNQGLVDNQGKELVWKPLSPPLGLLVSDNSLANLGDWAKNSYGVNFPHITHQGTRDSLVGPLGVEVTETAIEKAVEALQLGRGKHVDLLAVSFSTHDYVGHAFGPNSLEMEDLTQVEDRALSKFFNFLHRKVPGGLNKVLVVLTADHGIPPSPAWLKQNRMNAGVIDDKVLGEQLEKALTDKFGNPGDEKWIAAIITLNVFLNSKALEKRGADRKAVEDLVKDVLLKTEGIAFAFSSTDHKMRLLPPAGLETQILRTYFPGRSGDVVAIQRPYFATGADTVDHMSGYAYDRTVPILFSGPHIRPGIYAAEADVVDIAPTLSFLLGTVPPSLSSGKVLAEILK